jgi:hypothetical protein
LVEFIYFGISYDNPYSLLSFSLLPAPRSPLQAHVLASSPCGRLADSMPSANADRRWSGRPSADGRRGRASERADVRTSPTDVFRTRFS